MAGDTIWEFVYDSIVVCLFVVQGSVLVGQPAATQEGSAAGQLRLMTAQHHAQQHQPPPGILQSPSRPVTPAHIPPDQLLSYQVMSQEGTPT